MSNEQELVEHINNVHNEEHNDNQNKTKAVTKTSGEITIIERKEEIHKNYYNGQIPNKQKLNQPERLQGFGWIDF